MRTNCLGRPSISLYYHNSKESTKISYSKWDLCETDFNRVKKALSEIEVLLNEVPLTEDVKPVTPAPVKAEEVGPVVEEKKD